MARHWCRSVGLSVDLVSIDTGVGVSGGVGQCRGLVSKCRARAQHGSYVEVVEAGQSATSCSSTGFLKPTYDEQGRMKVMKPEMLLAVIMDMATGSKEMPGELTA